MYGDQNATIKKTWTKQIKLGNIWKCDSFDF